MIFKRLTEEEEMIKEKFISFLSNYKKSEIFLEETVDKKGYIYIRHRVFEEISNGLISLGVDPRYFENDEEPIGKMIGGLGDIRGFKTPSNYIEIYEFEENSFIEDDFVSYEEIFYLAMRILDRVVYSK